MKILVVGLGLIGGSFCKAIKKYTTHHMIGMDCDDATLEMAIAMESVDEVIPMDRPHLMSRADLVIVAIPPHKIVEFILENKDNFRKGAVVTDVCGVKKHIVDSLTEPLAEAGVEFIGSHPMAGTEFSGFSCQDGIIFLFQSADSHQCRISRQRGCFSKRVSRAGEIGGAPDHSRNDRQLGTAGKYFFKFQNFFRRKIPFQQEMILPFLRNELLQNAGKLKNQIFELFL